MTRSFGILLPVLVFGLLPAAGFAQQPFAFKEKVDAPKTEPAKPSPWREFVSKEGRFRVEFPGEAIPSEAEVQTPVGLGKLHLHSVPAIKMVYGAHYLDYPQSTKRMTSRQLLDAARDEAKQGLGGTIVEENSVSRGGLEGREIVFDVETIQAMVRVQYYVDGGRLYQVTVTGPRDGVMSNAAQRFFKSWELVKSP